MFFSLIYFLCFYGKPVLLWNTSYDFNKKRKCLYHYRKRFDSRSRTFSKTNKQKSFKKQRFLSPATIFLPRSSYNTFRRQVGSDDLNSNTETEMSLGIKSRIVIVRSVKWRCNEVNRIKKEGQTAVNLK